MIKRQSLLTISLCVAAIIAVMPRASAQEFRSITRTEATSQCIGDPKTPLCAVETFMACSLRRDIRLCRLVGRPKMSFTKRTVAQDYVVVSEEVIKKDEIPDHLKDTYWYLPGYVYIELDRRFHFADGTLYPSKGWRNYNYYLKPIGGQWHVVSWSATACVA